MGEEIFRIAFIYMHGYTKRSTRQTMSAHEPKPSWPKLYSFIQLKCIVKFDLMALISRFNELCLNLHATSSVFKQPTWVFTWRRWGECFPSPSSVSDDVNETLSCCIMGSSLWKLSTDQIYSRAWISYFWEFIVLANQNLKNTHFFVWLSVEISQNNTENWY